MLNRFYLLQNFYTFIAKSYINIINIIIIYEIISKFTYTFRVSEN